MSPTVSNNEITESIEAMDTCHPNAQPKNDTLNNANSPPPCDSDILPKKLTIPETDSGEASLSDQSNSPTTTFEPPGIETAFFSSEDSENSDDSETVKNSARQRRNRHKSSKARTEYSKSPSSHLSYRASTPHSADKASANCDIGRISPAVNISSEELFPKESEKLESFDCIFEGEQEESLLEIFVQKEQLPVVDIEIAPVQVLSSTVCSLLTPTASKEGLNKRQRLLNESIVFSPEVSSNFSLLKDREENEARTVSSDSSLSLDESVTPASFDQSPITCPSPLATCNRSAQEAECSLDSSSSEPEQLCACEASLDGIATEAQTKNKTAPKKPETGKTVAVENNSQDKHMENSSEMKPLNKSSSKVYGQPAVVSPESNCKICSKHVYHMEQIKAAKGVYHKACFRCTECSKQLSLDTYSSHEGRIYCKPHFKQLLQPQPVFTSEQVGSTAAGNNPSSPTEIGPPERKKYELIIAENEPLELPADVVRSSTKSEEIFENINLDLSNIRNRFEHGNASSVQEAPVLNKKPISRAESIHKIMQRYQNRVAGEKDMSDDEDTQSAPQNQSGDSGPDSVDFSGLSSLKSQWETGNVSQKAESVRVNDELEEIRAKAKSAEPVKNAYERALQERQQEARHADVHVESSGVHASGIKEKFEKGQFEPESEEDRLERMRKEREAEMNEIARSETCTKEARNKFKQIEQGQTSQPQAAVASNVANEEVSISSQELQNRFAYFESLNESQQSKAGQDQVDDCPKVDTTKKMLDKFKALESGQNNNEDSEPRTRKITPPREIVNQRKVFENEPLPEDPNIVKSSYKSEEKIEVEPAKARNLRAKFENWQSEMKTDSRKHADEEDEFVPTNGASKNLRAMFESIKAEGDKPVEKPRPRINRFVEQSQSTGAESCFVCSSRLYAMEKMEFSGIKIHKNCFRCNKCHCMLRLDNFTTHAEKLFCIPHFKQLFMEKGNYDEGFGLEQHKDKWSNKTSVPSSPAHPPPKDAEKNHSVRETESDIDNSCEKEQAEQSNVDNSQAQDLQIAQMRIKEELDEDEELRVENNNQINIKQALDEQDDGELRSANITQVKVKEELDEDEDIREVDIKAQLDGDGVIEIENNDYDPIFDGQQDVPTNGVDGFEKPTKAALIDNEA